MKALYQLVSILLLFTLSSWQAMAQQEVEFLEAEQAFIPTLEIQDQQLQLQWQIAPGYYLYRHSLKVSLQQGDEQQELVLNLPDGDKKYDPYFEKELEIYHQQLVATLRLPPTVAEGATLKVTAQGCAEEGLCYPPYTKVLPLTLPDGGSSASSGMGSFSLLVTLASAFLGGLILNLMPCVFPVLSLKALSFSVHSEEGPSHQQQGWAYTLGVLLSFCAFGLLIVIARASGEQLGWGFQLQQPWFVAAMAYLFFMIGLSLSGLLEFGGAFMGLGQGLTTGNGLKASFFTGVLATLVASPCTAPFMASALGVAMTQSALVALAIFFMLGFGMASPFLLLSYLPQLSHYLPKPGLWMDTFKQALAFPIYLTVIWLLWVYSHQSGSDGVILLLLGLFSIAFASWLLRHSPSSRLKKQLLRVVALAAIAVSGYLIYPEETRVEASVHSSESQFSMQRLEQLRASDIPVLVDLTADWCLTCKVNEKVAFTQTVKETLKAEGVELLVGDWTNANPEVEKLLKQQNRSGIPLYLYYPKGGADPQLLPQLLSETILLEAIDSQI